jgi:hypothetical protein
MTGYIGTLFGNVVGEVTLNQYTIDQLKNNIVLPASENLNKIVICKNEDNRCLAISDGLSWLKINIGEKLN